MTVSIPLLTLMVITVYVAYRHTGLKAWHAIVCLILGFLLAATGAAPAINNVLMGVLAWVHDQLTGGNG